MNGFISRPDSERFGFAVARINSFERPVPEVLEELRAAGVRLVIGRVRAEDVSLINDMERQGFRLKDIQVTHGFDLHRPVPSRFKDGIFYRGFISRDAPALGGIAAESFAGYGHYSRLDAGFDVNTSEIYRDWCFRCCRCKETADHIIVAEHNKVIMGFLALKILKQGREQAATAVMGAVSPEYRGRGIYRGLNIEALHWAARLGLGRLEQNILAENLAAHKTFASLGFYILGTRVTLHLLFS